MLESMKKGLPLIVAGTTALAGCGGKTVVDGASVVDSGNDAGVNLDAGVDSGLDGGLDSGSDASVDADSGVSEDLLTRRLFTTDLVRNVMGFNGECLNGPIYPDVPVNDDLCYPAEIMFKRDADKGYTDGQFHPDDIITRKQVWERVTKAIGLAAYDAPCLAGVSDVAPQNWFYLFGGAICDKDIPFAENGLARPHDNMTISEWDDLNTALNTYLGKNITRTGLPELALVEFYEQENFSDVDDCVSIFPDIPNGTLECETVNTAVNLGFVDGYPNGLFMPDNLMNYAELARSTTLAAGINPVVPPSGCSGNDPEAWYTQYLDALCPYSTSWDVGESVVMRDAYWLTWNLKMDLSE